MPFFAISFLLLLPYDPPNDELKELLASYWQKQNFKIVEKKIQVLEHFKNYQLTKSDTIPCLGGKSPFEFQEIALSSTEIWIQPKTIIIDSLGTSKNWSKAFIKPFNSNEDEVHASDLVQISDSSFLIGYQSSSGDWLDLVWVDNDLLKTCTLTYSVND